MDDRTMPPGGELPSNMREGKSHRGDLAKGYSDIKHPDEGYGPMGEKPKGFIRRYGVPVER